MIPRPSSVFRLSCWSDNVEYTSSIRGLMMGFWRLFSSGWLGKSKDNLLEAGDRKSNPWLIVVHVSCRSFSNSFIISLRDNISLWKSSFSLVNISQFEHLTPLTYQYLNDNPPHLPTAHTLRTPSCVNHLCIYFENHFYFWFSVYLWLLLHNRDSNRLTWEIYENSLLASDLLKFMLVLIYKLWYFSYAIFTFSSTFVLSFTPFSATSATIYTQICNVITRAVNYMQ